FVVILLRIAQLYLGARGLGEFRLERENFPGMISGRLLRFAGEDQHFGDVLDVLVAQLFRSVVRLRVIVAIRQTQPALSRLGDIVRAVLRVLAGAKLEEGAYA